jgi:predicted nucleotidyltransferase
MRLSSFEKQSIITNFKARFPNSKLYLFGSRIDDTKKGGDIDLYIETTTKEYDYIKVLELNAKIQDEIGWQKIDIVVNQLDKNQDKLIYKNAKSTGVILG